MMNSIADVDVRGKKVLVRLDLDVPVDDGEVGDLTRLKAALPTLRYILAGGGSPVILSHAGRPDGKIDEKLSLRPMLSKLNRMLGFEYVYEVITEPMPPLEGTIFSLENLRFDAREEANDPGFAQYLASFGDIYVNDAFAVSHRAHASIEGITHLLPSYAGLHLIEEVAQLEQAIDQPPHPVVVVLGGAKVETKLPAIERMSKIADHILLGGKLAAEASSVDLPQQVIVGQLTENGLDITAASARELAEKIAAAKTIIWNGPVGKFEEPPSDTGTRIIAEAIAANTEAHRLIGGGDTVTALDAFGLADQVGYVSTGGGAMLDFLAGRELPGLKALGYQS